MASTPSTALATCRYRFIHLPWPSPFFEAGALHHSCGRVYAGGRPHSGFIVPCSETLALFIVGRFVPDPKSKVLTQFLYGRMASSLTSLPIYDKAKATKIALQRPTTSRSVSTTAALPPNSHAGIGAARRTSLSSFPATRSPSVMSNSRPPRSPNVPAVDADPASDLGSNSKSTSSGLSSQHSSLSGHPRHNLEAHPKRRLRSQYPRGEGENHVEYILVASFDIDKGPIMEHQYPVAITGDEHMLAELMLPDQAHVRNQDWTIFFLHKDTTEEDEEAERREERRRRRQRSRDKAAGIVNSDDEDQMEYDVEDNEGVDDDSEESEEDGGEGPPLIYVLNLVNTKQDKTAKRGAVVKAMAICTRHPFLHIYKV